MVTSPELKDRFFAGSEGAYRRIRYLINMGVLKVILIDANRNRVLGITPMGMSYVRQGAGAFEYPLRPRYYTSVDHDLMVLDLRATFEKCKAITSLLPENLVAADLRRKYGRNARVDRDFKLPDAVVCFETTKKHYAAVELELTRKSKKRLERTFRLLMFSGDFTISLFIVKDLPLLKLLSGIYDEIWDQPWSHSGSIHCCYFVTLDEFRTKGPDAVFTGRDRTFTFRELETYPPSTEENRFDF